MSRNEQPTSRHHPFKLAKTKIACFFRDDGLSDLIGFDYSKWHADDAVSDLIKHLMTIAANESEEDSVASIIMDGENAWEYFPRNGHFFLSALYKQLSSHPDIELTTFSECLKNKVPVKPLKKFLAGSWLYGTFSTWIGEGDKNRGWDMLCHVKLAFDQVIADKRLSNKQLKKAEYQLAVCEDSD